MPTATRLFRGALEQRAGHRLRVTVWEEAEAMVCEDYRDSLEAAARFEVIGTALSARAEEYRQLAAELLAEATAMSGEIENDVGTLETGRIDQ